MNNEILVHDARGCTAPKSVLTPALTGTRPQLAQRVRTSLVKDGSPRTVAKHGLTRHEVRRIDGGVMAIKTLARQKRQQVCWASFAADSGSSISSQFRKRLVTLQRQETVEQVWLAVSETDPDRHDHIIFLTTPALMERLKASPRFQQPVVKIGPVYDAKGLVGYLSKESTSQAAYRNWAVPRRKQGSHQLPGGGDRVRVSERLKAFALEQGYIEPWQPTNAKRASTRKSYRLRKLSPKKAPRPANQEPLPFAEMALRRPVARLRDYGGGPMPSAVAEEIEFRRRQDGLSQRELANRCGIGQPQLANALRGHDPLSAWVVTRIKEVLTPASGISMAGNAEILPLRASYSSVTRVSQVPGLEPDGCQRGSTGRQDMRLRIIDGGSW